MRWQGHAEYDWRLFLPGYTGTSGASAVPLWQFALLAFGDQLCVAMQSAPSAFLSQTLQSLLSQTTIIWVALFAAIFLRTQYKLNHYLAFFLVLLSVVVDLASELVFSDCSDAGVRAGRCLSAYMGATGRYQLLGSAEMLLWIIIFLVSVVPMAASNVYKQHILQGRDADVNYFSWWGGNFQVLWGWLCIPLLWIKLPNQSLSPDSFFEVIANTWSCLWGVAPGPGDETCVTSPPPAVWFLLYLLFNIAFSVLILWLTKHMSAAWTLVAMVLCLDLTNVLGMVPIIAGGGAQTMEAKDWLATLLASLALLVYELRPAERRAAGEGEVWSEASPSARAGASLPLVHAEEA
eukprot:TRINITY_DN12698_c0_g2_i3.p1 TRINITY_DN12698_c0_g2~~TRINITY_DN12698_c0_g2_i3.p1  ORF type:complete len:349 (-),score=90.75 TRINITY_DN12698_c0_g2_i3:496-1542(-)